MRGFTYIARAQITSNARLVRTAPVFFTNETQKTAYARRFRASPLLREIASGCFAEPSRSNEFRSAAAPPRMDSVGAPGFIRFVASRGTRAPQRTAYTLFKNIGYEAEKNCAVLDYDIRVSFFFFFSSFASSSHFRNVSLMCGIRAEGVSFVVNLFTSVPSGDTTYL